MTEAIHVALIALAAGTVPAILGYLTSMRRAKTLAGGVASKTTREEYAALYTESRLQLEDARTTINSLRGELTSLRIDLDLERQKTLAQQTQIETLSHELGEERKERLHLQWVVDQIQRDGEDKRRGRR